VTLDQYADKNALDSACETKNQPPVGWGCFWRLGLRSGIAETVTLNCAESASGGTRARAGGADFADQISEFRRAGF
jgi:hypothetical protein